MTNNARSFLLGFAAASAAFILTAFVWSGLRDGMLRSKSKRFLANGSAINAAVLRYHERYRSYPQSKAEVLKLCPQAEEGDFDYFGGGTEYTLIYPSLTGQMRWEPYVFINGKLAAWPGYMNEEIRARSGPPSN